MDLTEALFHANWPSCSAETPSGEYSEMMAQLLSTPSITNNREPDVHVPSLGHAPFFWSDHCAESSYFSYNSDPSNGCLLPPPDLGCHNLGHPNAAREYSHTASSIWNIMGFCAVGEEEANAPSTFPVAAINEETSSEDVVAGRSSSANQVESAFLTSCPKSSPKRKSHVHGQVADSIADAVPRKKLRSLQKNGKNEQPRKTQKGVGVRGDAGESINGGGNGRDSGSCISEEESTSSQEVHGRSGTSLGTTSSAASDPNGKARAGRGTSTDPQSLYARKRRERINERLRILQSLVPNGTKVDISTMLEEAVQYVKFLQLQIKLLSSDELWMYAPIAYNGMDIGQLL